ncbi:hypothetical protein FA95DRAFT_1604262 [Auriscalpium vulgare]|uniref:Uncharacterized protein n=1 Tax=Auriscalpium vulgare TaxID=40419 RepID=A0ACB8S0H3_9AGAM|nr:hypothetical protein FA95DRAFT_1604262 [Auriscalpium vulgare]
MSLIARAPALRRSLLRSRLAAPARGSHGEYKHIPFATTDGQSKAVFGGKVVAFLAAGFILPFAASAYQLKKAGGG